MKKTIAVLLGILMILALTSACGASGGAPTEETPPEAEPETSPIVGGWERTDSPEVTDEVRALFDKATDGLVGAEYTPVAYIATQVVAGRNHALVCKMAPVTLNAAETYVIVHLYEDLQGNVKLSDVFASDAETNTRDLPGGWTDAESPVVTDELRAALDSALERLLGVKYSPVALLSTQLVSGTNYCVLCEKTPVVPDAETTYALVYLYVDLSGNAEIKDILDFAASAE